MYDKNAVGSNYFILRHVLQTLSDEKEHLALVRRLWAFRAVSPNGRITPSHSEFRTYIMVLPLRGGLDYMVAFSPCLDSRKIRI